MDEENKMTPRPLFSRGDPFRDWLMPSRLFNREVEFPPFLDDGDLGWLEWAKKRLTTTNSWPGQSEATLNPPPGSEVKRLLPVTEGTSEVSFRHGSWRVSLDVNQFTPDDISVRAKDGYLEIAGKHQERQDVQGLVSRSFNRKYRLPDEVDADQIGCSLSPEGVLSIQAPMPATGTKRTEEIVIPIQMEQLE